MLKRVGIFGVAMCIAISAWPCEYNVRDVGFVDFDNAPYQLFVLVDDSVPDAAREAVSDAALLDLMDANLEAEVVDMNGNVLPEVKALIEQAGLDIYPAALLVSPVGFIKGYTFDSDPAKLGTTVQQLFDAVLASPARSEIVQSVVNTYGTVLVVEGTDADENARVREEAQQAVRTIHTRMKMLPKAIANPPVVHTITAEQREAESMLMWSLGIPTKTVGDEPYVAILYGRLRQMGPVLVGESIDAERLASYLAVIGADCECGLDRSWMQGTMMPSRWEDDVQEQAANTLGFDPENPRTKMEISMTVAKGQRNSTNSGSDTKNPDKLTASKITFGYSEEAVVFDGEPGDTVADETIIASLEESSRLDPPSVEESLSPAVEPEPEPESPRRNSGDLILLAAGAALILGAAGFILIRARNRES